MIYSTPSKLKICIWSPLEIIRVSETGKKFIKSFSEIKKQKSRVFAIQKCS